MPRHRNPSRTRRRAIRPIAAALTLTLLLAGIPWGLVRYIGWPLPRTLPTWPTLEALLLTPMSTDFLLKAMACVLWPVWAAFLHDVARAAADELSIVPHPTIPRPGPLTSLAALLVGTVIMALLTQRPTTLTTPPATVAISTPVQQSQLALTAEPVTVRQAKHPTEGTVEVRPPHDGIYDSLWRIAERTLGDGTRWPQLYTLNKGRPQPDGRTLTNPNPIRPGWILHLPDHPHPHVRVP